MLQLQQIKRILKLFSTCVHTWFSNQRWSTLEWGFERERERRRERERLCSLNGERERVLVWREREVVFTERRERESTCMKREKDTNETGLYFEINVYLIEDFGSRCFAYILSLSLVRRKMYSFISLSLSLLLISLLITPSFSCYYYFSLSLFTLHYNCQLEVVVDKHNKGP